MDISPLRLRRPEDEAIECWDDDEDLQCGDEIYFRTVSSATSVTGCSVRPSGHRDSISSRRSCRSDRESNYGDEESWQLLLNDQDEFGTDDAIASAKNAGIPIPNGIPRSALLGGTIKRLGGRKGKKALGDDWSEDLDLAGLSGEIQLRFKHEATSPESLLHLSSLPTSPSKSRELEYFTDIINHPPAPKQQLFNDLDKFKDTEEDASFDDVPTIKLGKSRPPPISNPFATSTATEPGTQDDNMEADLVLPSDGEPLRLSTRRETSKAPDAFGDEFDAEWAEGSIGVRFGGTKREGFSTRSSTVSALSPSVSSCLTAESDDEGFNDFVLPDGPLDLGKSLQKRQESALPVDLDFPPEPEASKQPDPAADDFFSGIELGDGELFDTEKLTLNRNIKRKVERPASPARRGATTITFTSRTPGTRIPRLSDRPHSTQLEPVSESGAPVSKFVRPASRLSGHATHSSLSNISISSAGSASSNPPSRRPSSSRSSKDTIQSTSTNSQLLKTKRSIPGLRNYNAGMASTLQRSPGRQESNLKTRATVSPRPKTPVNQSTAETRLGPQRRHHVPFIPAGASPNQSHHVSLKTSRHFRRADSDSSGDMFTHHRSNSRVSSSSALSDTTRRGSTDLPTGSFTAGAKHAVTKPNRKRHFGDGTELDIFDDLPTSATAESKYVKVPIKKGPPRALRNRLSQSGIPLPCKTETTGSSLPTSPPHHDHTPRFARDTNASRNAREQRIASMTHNQRERENGPLTPISVNWRSPPFSRPPSSPTMVKSRPGHKHRNSISRPHLIKPMGSGVHEPKSVKGMKYNPTLYRWEGNETATAAFDPPALGTPPKSTLALISNIGGISGAQVVGSMVFDPQRMCWLKLASPGKTGATIPPEEDDVFAGLEDLDDRPQKSNTTSRIASAVCDIEANDPLTGDDKSGDSSDDWPITEEFDVGPEFIKRQRAEEEKWRRKVSKWASGDRNKLGDSWRWAIRDLVKTDAPIDVPLSYKR
ncbi:hypothetical protein CPC735_028450 [Coccidioides posadasii C735 delta SOWgp]|uniref:Cytokinesis regulator n=1 Tax=Coccidioides posadasii (strain C735) TaxID=222929 RepID=C5P7V9_COCP7|nr:hypothetical protein CPC735_028450 [Coccidioides posadasii C735 delta SOWgp]EER27509.1 hypothetical protein CPC735_028450 [Coccidioides posadasii C735 delta SOWgp]|eukprot:XP_003069654.1 hypothetical protein CPC735_028450 [Coccidioides posadasii C735 delta SOWgp]